MCKVDWCEEKPIKLGYCNRHYLQMRRFGKILPIVRNRNTPQEFEFYGNDCHIILYDRSGSKIASAVVDAGDYELVKPYKFNFSGRTYVRISGKSKEGFLFLHQLLLQTKWVDHADTDRLNNRRSNLRSCTNQQNQFNQKLRSVGLSKYKGVSMLQNRPSPYRAQIQLDGVRIHLGSFAVETKAALAYNKAAKEYFGEFARLNVI
jgi:hypothetical protein